MADVNRGNRPLSPHLQVYRLPIAAIASIMTRITGHALVAGIVLRNLLPLAPRRLVRRIWPGVDDALALSGCHVLFAQALAANLLEGHRPLVHLLNTLFPATGA
mgnify:CR=1 FL=1